MSIEETLADALADLREAIADGEAQEAALASVAAEHGLKPDVLRSRAAKAYGDLSVLQSRVCLERERGRRNADVHAAIVSFCNHFLGAGSESVPYPDPQSWVEDKLGFALEQSEQAELQEKRSEAWMRWQMRELDRLMKNAQN